MAIDQLHLIFQFCLFVGGLLAVAAVALKSARYVARPTGTYGDGLPERRKRPRTVLRDPAEVRASLEASKIAA